MSGEHVEVGIGMEDRNVGPNGHGGDQAVGADGRRSVTRRALGITLERQPETSYIAGLLLDGLRGVSDDHDVLIGEDDRLFLLFHQGDGRARAYVCTGLSGQHRFAGRDGAVRFLEACAVCRATRGASSRHGDARRSLRHLSRRRHLVRRAVRGRRRADR